MRRNVVSSLAILLMGFTAIHWFTIPGDPLEPIDPVSRATYEEIRIGMSLPEVEDLMGGPGGFWDDFDFRSDAPYIRPDRRVTRQPVVWTCEGNMDAFDWLGVNINTTHQPGDDGIHCWLGPRGGIAVHADERGRVTNKLYQEGRRTLTLPDRLPATFVHPINNRIGF